MIRFMYPRVLFEPPSKFKVGYPEAYAVGAVSTRWKRTHKVWIVRVPKGFYAVLARCTHLGCTPGWFGTEDKFKCFCHGSGFRKSGLNYEGPAPRALERVEISLANDGQLQIIVARGDRFEKVASYRVSENDTYAPPVLLKNGVLVKDSRTLTRWALQ